MTTTAASTGTRTRSLLYSAVIGLAALTIVLQGLWAGLFVKEGQDYEQSWVGVHDWGARIAIGLALLATVVAVVRLRSRRDLVLGSAALAVLLFVESYVGGEIGDKPGWTAVHFPLAMALVGLSVWLPLRATRR